MHDVPVRRIVITCDASAITRVDAATVDALARLQLAAGRMGMRIELRNACPQLVDLLDLVGLLGLIEGADGLLGEVHGQAEECEQVGVDEEVDPGDHTV